MTRGLRILVACAVALMVIGAGGLAALIMISWPPQTINRNDGFGSGDRPERR